MQAECSEKVYRETSLHGYATHRPCSGNKKHIRTEMHWYDCCEGVRTMPSHAYTMAHPARPARQPRRKPALSGCAARLSICLPRNWTQSASNESRTAPFKPLRRHASSIPELGTVLEIPLVRLSGAKIGIVVNVDDIAVSDPSARSTATLAEPPQGCASCGGPTLHPLAPMHRAAASRTWR